MSTPSNFQRGSRLARSICISISISTAARSPLWAARSGTVTETFRKCVRQDEFVRDDWLTGKERSSCHNLTTAEHPVTQDVVRTG
jgi:hypothetical protein